MHIGISESISIHETKLELEYGINSEELADASINPKYRTVRHWYDTWKLNNLGSSTELSVLQVCIVIIINFNLILVIAIIKKLV